MSLDASVPCVVDGDYSPVLDGDRLLGVLDVDSPRPGRFDARDEAGLAAMLEVLLANAPVIP